MHRIYQSRRKLTASIASAAKAEEELRASTQEGTQPSSPLSGEKNNHSGCKRPLEDTFNEDSNGGIFPEQKIGKTDSENDGQGSSSPAPCSSPQHKKAATFRSPETRTSTEQTSEKNDIISITPIKEKNASPVKVNNNGNTKTTSTASEVAVAASSEASPLRPDRTAMAIDLRTPLSQSSEIEIINSQLQPPAYPEIISKDQQGDNDDNEDCEIQILSQPTPANPTRAADAINTSEAPMAQENNEKGMDNESKENDEEIQIVSSTTINPNIQYPHKRTDCGVFDFANDPIKFCDKCYCIVCDIPARECKQWGDHSTVKCRPVTNSDADMADDEGYDVTDEILLESPTTTARNYYNRRNRGYRSSEDQPRRLQEGGSENPLRRYIELEHAKKLKIQDVLSKKLRMSLSISEGARVDSNKEKQKQGESKPTQQRNAMEGDIPQLGLHSSFFVEGIKIGWPFPKIMLPQRQMAMHIIKGLKRKLHVVVESPTGTGKSVAILCSVLAWQRYYMQTKSSAKRAPSYSNSNEEDKAPQIIYCSRTHSQVTQMVASLKKTPYRPTMTILGSRERMCIHKALTGENKKKNKMTLSNACQIRRRNTESDRKKGLNSHTYDDDNPPLLHSDNIGDHEGEDGDDGGNSAEDGNENTNKNMKPKPTCPHFRRLSSIHTADIATKRFMGGHRLRGDGEGCCGNSSGVGGEESAFGVHDMEDLIRFGKNPSKEENISIYRGRNGKFGFLVNNNMNESGETTRGCHVVSLVEGGAASYEARLEAGDKILKINGNDVRTWNKRKVVDLLSQTPKNQPARLVVLRKSSDTLQLLDPENDLMGVHNLNQPVDVYSDHSVCPYYLSRAIQSHAELTFAPYNYILDPGIRKAIGIGLKNSVVVLDEAHNVESTLCEGASGKYGEIDLCHLVCILAFYSRRTLTVQRVSLTNGEEIDTATLAHELLLFVEKLILHMQALREKFETSPGRTKLEEDYEKYHSTPDNHEIELTFDGPTGYGVKGAAVGCQPFLTRLGITTEECIRLHEYASSMEQALFAGNSDDDDVTNDSKSSVGESSTALTVLVELLSKMVRATKHAEHYYISCVAQANGNLEHAFGIEEENGSGSRRFKKKPRTVPFLNPRTIQNPLAHLPVCQHKECNPTHEFNPPNAVRHGNYCNGSTPHWECHLVLRLLSPGLLMREISEECHSVILASGSLAPLPSVCAELNLFGKDSSLPVDNQKSIVTGQQVSPRSQPMVESSAEVSTEKLYTNRLQTTPKPLEANHVVNLQKQLLAVSIGHFPNGEKLTVSYSNYNNNPSFLPKFGHAVASVVEGVPKGGCLVFFPSYSFLKKCVACWNPESNESGFSNNSRRRSFANNRASRNNSNENKFIWERFLRSKGKVIVEPTGSQEEFEAARDDFKETIASTGSCMLLAVFRGKMSEGISFDDDNSRAVICIGMPLPNWGDRGVKAKMAYNDEQRKLRKKTCLLPGREFYAQQAYRAISQALGRCIRHGADYGTVILMDSRHCHDGSPMVGSSNGICRAHLNFPKWMRGAIHTLSMEREDRRQPNGHLQPKMLYGGYAGLRREMRQFFANAPQTSQEVLNQWKTDREKAVATSARGSNVIFHRDTGNWTAVGQAPTQTKNADDTEHPNTAGIQI